MDNNQMMMQALLHKESGSKKFWRIVLGSAVGFIFSSIIVSFLSLFLMIGMMAGLSSEKPVLVKDNSILKLELDKQIVERATKSPFDDLNINMFGNESTIGLDQILSAIKNASNDPKIKGISLNVKYVAASPATVTEIRDALEKFKKSGKFIYAYSEIFTQGAYYLCSVADSIYLNPSGDVTFTGISAQVMFYKGLLDKLDAEIQVVRHGQFKSAVEPFITDKMSEANRAQYTQFTNSLWDVITNKISTSRNISVDSLNVIANKLLCNSANQALAIGLVDKLCYATDYDQILKKITADPLSYVSLADYNKTTTKLSEKDANIAMIYAYGNIVDGKADEGNIGSLSICKEIKKATQNKNVKAIVLRVNSGGGSALASEVIWQQIEEAKKAGKIVVTSMGDYAASGGYYIACNSNAIVAQPNTLTGSIGVFGMIPNMQKLLKNKLGITIDVVKTNDHADMMSGFRPMDAAELQTIQISIEEIYSQFIGRVAAGRKMTAAQVDSIGQGRVWAGSDAIKIGLVDQLGNIDDAVALAAKLANLENYSLICYPAQKEWYEKLFNNNTQEEINAALKKELGDLYFVYKGLNSVLDQKGIQARMPFEMKFDW